MSCNGIEPLLGTPVPAQIPWPGEIPGTAAPSCGAASLSRVGALRKGKFNNAEFMGMDFKKGASLCSRKCVYSETDGLGNILTACSLMAEQAGEDMLQRGVC